MRITYNEPRHQRRQVATRTDRVGRDVRPKLRDNERRRDEPDLFHQSVLTHTTTRHHTTKNNPTHPKPLPPRRPIVQKPPEELDRRPDRLAVDRLRRRADDDADEGDEGEGERDGEDLRPQSGGGRRCAGGEVGGVAGVG